MSAPRRKGEVYGYLALINLYAIAAVDDRLTPSERRVLVLLGKYADQDGTCCVPIKRIADKLGESRQAIQKCARALEHAGYLTSRRRTRSIGADGANVFVFNLEMGALDACPLFPPDGGAPARGCSGEQPPEVAHKKPPEETCIEDTSATRRQQLRQRRDLDGESRYVRNDVCQQGAGARRGPSAWASIRGTGRRRNEMAQRRKTALFAAVPIRAMSDRRLTASHHRVLQAIAYHDRPNSNIGCFAGHGTLAREASVEYTNLSKCTRELREWGYLSRDKSPRNGRNWIYRVIRELDQTVGQSTNCPDGTVGPENGQSADNSGENPKQYIPLSGSEENGAALTSRQVPPPPVFEKTFEDPAKIQRARLRADSYFNLSSEEERTKYWLDRMDEEKNPS